MSGPGYDPRGSGRSRRAGQVLQALMGLNLSGEGGSVNVAALASGTINYVLTSSANSVVITFDTPGATSWTSSITGNCLVECWGPGGTGTTYGAGGGEYRSDTIAVVANTVYPLFIGDPTLGFTNTSFNSTSVVAIGGANATSSGAGAGGTGGTGATGFAGGAGGAGGAAPGDDLGGGGGGSSAGTAAIGVNGAGRSSAAGGAGGTAPSGGGNGGNGGTSANGQNGQAPGGGGGGKSSGSTTPGVGAKGKIRLTYTAAGTVSSWQPIPPYPMGANPTATIGLTAVNGTAATFLRSDGAPPLSQAIVPTWTGLHTFSPAQSFNTVVVAVDLQDPTVAPASGRQQYSGAIHFGGSGWKTIATAGPQAVEFRMYAIPKQGSVNPTGHLLIESQVNGAGYGGSFAFSTAGGFSTSTNEAAAGVIDATTGFTINFTAAAAGHYLRGNGTAYVDSLLLIGDLNTLGVYAPSTADLLAQTAGVASVLAVTSPNDGAKHQYVVGVYVNITAVTLDVVVLQVLYTDENSVAQTVSFYPMGLTSANLAATGVYSFPNTLIRVASNTSITLKANLTTGTGSITYDVGGLIQRVN